MFTVTDLKDRNNNIIKVGDKIRFSNDTDMLYPDEIITIEGEAVFACGSFGLGTDDYIPDELSMCGNDNFVSFWELYNALDLVEYSDLSEYFEIIETCEDCPFNSKCENQDKCRG